MTATETLTHGVQTLPTLAAPEGRPPAAFRDVCGRSETGAVRSDNQDHFLMVDVERVTTVRGSSVGTSGLRKASVGTLLVVADGMGGHTNGELASAIAIDTLAAFAARALPADPELGEPTRRSQEGFQRAAYECQRRIREAALRRGAPLDLGTTMTALYAYEGVAEIAHVGDSRAYLVRPGVGGWRLTHDHTLAASLEERTGEPAPGVAHVLTNAIGATEEAPRVEALHVPIQAQDRFLLCSDGLTDYVEDAVIRTELEAASSAADAVDRLFRRVLATEAGDNVTVLVAFV